MGGVAYTLFLLYQSRKEKDPIVQSEYAQFGARSHSPKEIALNGGLFVVGLGMLVVGSQLLVDSAIAIATILGASPLLIGLTVVAVGTSLPELATSVMASLRGESDIAVGNVVGSNIFNILIVLGVSSSTAPSGIAVPPTAISFDIPIMIAVALMCFPICFTASRISRREGVLLLVCYLLYTSYLVVSTGSPAHSSWSGPSGWIGFGAVSLTLLLAVAISLQTSKAKRDKHLNR